MAGGGSTTAGLQAPAQSSGNTGSPKGPGSPIADQMNQMKTSDGRSFGDATGKTPGQPQPQVMPAQTATTVAPGGTSGIDPNLYKPMVSGYPAFDPSKTAGPGASYIPPNAGITPYNPGMSPFANQFAQGQANLSGLGQQIGLPPGPGMPAGGNPATGQNPLNFANPGQPMSNVLPDPVQPVAQTAATPQIAATPQTQPMNPNRQRDMDQHDMRNNRMDNDKNEMQRPGRRYGQNEMQRPGMRYGNYMEKTTPPGIAGLNSADRMKRMQ